MDIYDNNMSTKQWIKKSNQTYTQIYMETNTNMYRNIYKYV